MKQILTIATRKSPLALRQVDLVVEALTQQHPGFADEYEPRILGLTSSGDAFLETTLKDIGGKGLFTKEIDEALLAGEADISVHSAKDMPTALPSGIDWPCVLPRADARDYYISSRYPNFADLPDDAHIGTASLRRQLLAKQLKPRATITPLRGNVQTRLRKLEAGEMDATFLAAAGLQRLGLTPPGHVLELEQFIPAPAQGIVAIHCRSGDARMAELLHSIHCPHTHSQALIEREILRQLDGSCRTPIGAHAQITDEHFTLDAMLGCEETGTLKRLTAEGKLVDYVRVAGELAGRLKEA